MKYWTEVIAIGAVVRALEIAILSRQNSETGSGATPKSNENPGYSFALRDVRVFDGRRMIERVNVILRNGLIANVGADVPIAEYLSVVDGAGRTLMPGLIDAHAHSWGDASGRSFSAPRDCFPDPRRRAQVQRAVVVG